GRTSGTATGRGAGRPTSRGVGSRTSRASPEGRAGRAAGWPPGLLARPRGGDVVPGLLGGRGGGERPGGAGPADPGRRHPAPGGRGRAPPGGPGARRVLLGGHP